MHSPVNEKEMDRVPPSPVCSTSQSVEQWLNSLPLTVPTDLTVGENHINFMATLSEEIECFEPRVNPVSEVKILLVNEGSLLDETLLAKPTGKVPCPDKDLAQFAKLPSDNIFQLETETLALEKSEKLFQPEETENLHGEFERDLERFQDNTRLLALLRKYENICGPLPPPSVGCPLVQMDIKLKEE